MRTAIGLHRWRGRAFLWRSDQQVTHQQTLCLAIREMCEPFVIDGVLQLKTQSKQLPEVHAALHSEIP